MDAINPFLSKQQVFKIVRGFADECKLSVQSIDSERPWGGFFIIDDRSIETFLNLFFPDEKDGLSGKNVRIRPKFLVVAPEARLSWQYHFRRSELWKVLKGPVGIVTSDSDSENDTVMYNSGDIITIEQGKRHRLIGLENWGVVAEIWRHTDVTNLSTEEDIVRLQDDYNR